MLYLKVRRDANRRFAEGVELEAAEVPLPQLKPKSLSIDTSGVLKYSKQLAVLSTGFVFCCCSLPGCSTVFENRFHQRVNQK